MIRILISEDIVQSTAVLLSRIIPLGDATSHDYSSETSGGMMGCWVTPVLS